MSALNSGNLRIASAISIVEDMLPSDVRAQDVAATLRRQFIGTAYRPPTRCPHCVLTFADCSANLTTKESA